MNFKDLSKEQKEDLHDKLMMVVKCLEGKNFFLSFIEELRAESVSPLLNKYTKHSYDKATLAWNKSIYEGTLKHLFNSIKREEANGDMIAGINPKEYKDTMNMMRTLKPIEITICDTLTFPILDVTEPKKTKISLLFKIIFFYNISFAREVLAYEKR